MSGLEPKIAIAWSGLPFYASRLIRAGISAIGEPVAVIGTLPKVPISGMEEALGQPIHWIDEGEPTSWKAIGLTPPRVFFHTGWRFAAFNSLGRETRRLGGRVISMIDNNRKASFRQWVGAIVFRSVYHRWFWGVWVPGSSGEKLCRFLGAPGKRIYRGLYGADPAIFGTNLTEAGLKPKRFIFVGQLIERKGVRELLAAFSMLRKVQPASELIVVGAGPLECLCRDAEGVQLVGFTQPADVAHMLAGARCLVLPSHEEHWGLVVHEAALSGCVLLLTDSVGAAEDLLGSQNGIRVRDGSVAALASAMEEIAQWDLERVRIAAAESVQRASRFGPEVWAGTFTRIVSDLREECREAFL